MIFKRTLTYFRHNPYSIIFYLLQDGCNQRCFADRGMLLDQGLVERLGRIGLANSSQGSECGFNPAASMN